MFGNPYSFTIYANQSKTFDISKVGTIDGMTLYFYQNNDFEYYDNDGKIKKINSIVPNIFVKDIYIAFGVETSSIQDNTIKLYNTENSSFNYTSPTDSTNTKNLGFLWYNKNEDGDYIGFSDGIVDVKTKEILLMGKTDPDENGICECTYIDNENNVQIIKVHKDNIINKEDKYYITIYTNEIIHYDELEYIKLSTENNRLMEQMAKDVPTDENGLDISASITEGENIFSKVTKLIQVNLLNTLTDFYQRTKSLVGINETLSSNDYFNNATTGKVNIASDFGEDIEIAYKGLIDWYKDALSAAAAIQKYQSDKTQPEEIKIVQVDENNTYTQISNLYTEFKNQYINNGFILKELYDTISFKYSAFQSIYDTYSIKIEKIFVELDDYFGLLENLLGDKEKNITSNNNPEANNIDEEFKYVFNKPIIKYTERDFSNMENRYCVYWYRYTPGYIDKDKIMEDNWKRLVPEEEIQSSTINTIIMPNNLGLPENFNLIGGINRFEKKAGPENNHLTVYLDPNRQEEKFKVVLFYNHEKYESNELVFTNLETVPDATTLDSADAIEITHSTNSMESYQTLYGSNNTLINQGHSLVNRKLRLHYNGLLGGDESLIGASIYWYVPRNATMLTVNVNKLTELGDNERPVFNSDYYRSAEVIAGDSDKNTALIYTGPSSDYQIVENLEYPIGEVLKSIYDYKNGFYSLKSSNAIGVGGQWISEENIKIIDNEEIYMDGYACFYKQKVNYIEEIDEETGETVQIPKEEDLEFEYRIKNYYVPTSLNNTIFCLVKKDNYEFETSISMMFGTQGTSGTDYTILIQPVGNQTAVSESDILELSVQGFNYNNEEILIEKAIIPNEGSLFNQTVKWKGPSVYNLAFVPSEVTDKNLIINSAEVSVGEQAGIYTYGVKDEETGEITIIEEYPNYCGMAEIVMGLNDSRYGASSKDLSVIYPIAWSADKYFIEGSTSIIYDSFGSNPAYYKESYKIYDRATNNEITDVEWKIRYFMQKES